MSHQDHPNSEEPDSLLGVHKNVKRTIPLRPAVFEKNAKGQCMTPYPHPVEGKKLYWNHEHRYLQMFTQEEFKISIAHIAAFMRVARNG